MSLLLAVPSGTASVSAGAQATSTGQKNASGSASCSARPQATSTGQKNAAGVATASARTQVISTGFAPIVASGSASMSARPRATSTGAKGGQGVATASNTPPRAVSTGAKGGQSAATASARTTTTSTGVKGGRGAASASNTTPRATSTGAKGGQSTATCSARTRATSTGAKGGASTATCSAHPQTTASGRKGGIAQGSVLTDDFDDGSVCTGRWPAANGVSESGGQGVLPFILDGDWIASTFRTASDKRINDRTFTVEVVRAHGSSAGTLLFGVGRDTGVPFANIYVSGLNIIYEFNDGTYSFVSQVYDPAVHRWWRIREAAGTVHLETSADGVSWTVRKTNARTREWGLQPLKVWASKNSAAAIPDALIDNLSVTEPGVRISASPRATSTGAKGGRGAAAVALRTRVTATGSTAEAHQGSASCSTGTRVTASGAKSGQGAASASAKTRADASGTKATQGTSSASAAGRVTTSGTKHTDGQAAISGSAAVNAVGEKAASGSATASARATVTVTVAVDVEPIVETPGVHAHPRTWNGQARVWDTHERTGMTVGVHRRRLVD